LTCIVSCTFLDLVSLIFFISFPSPTEIHTLSLHDALPISFSCTISPAPLRRADAQAATEFNGVGAAAGLRTSACAEPCPEPCLRSEEHTSELQSHLNLVCRLLLEKKKNTKLINIKNTSQI